MPTAIATPATAPADVFTGLEGLVTVQDLEKARAKRQASQFAADANQLNGQQFAARSAGRLIGDVIGKAFGPGKSEVRAQKSQDAVAKARKAVEDQEFDGAQPEADRNIAIVTGSIRELEEQGLSSEADALRGNLVQLRKNKLTQAQELAKLDDQVVSTANKRLDTTLKGLEIKDKQGEAPGQDEVTRLMNQMDGLDPTQPEDALKLDTFRARLSKLVSITGKTQFDVSDKVLFRNSLEDLAKSRDGLDRLQGIQSSFNPEFQTLQGKVENFGIGLRDMLDLPLSDDEKKQFAEYKEFTTKTTNNLNLYIKEITGAQMSAEEAVRLSAGLPNSSDTPLEFQTKLTVVMDELEAALRKNVDIARADASGDPLKSINARNVSKSVFIKQIQAERDPVGAILGN